MSAITRLSDLASNVESRSFIDTFEEGLRYFMGEGELNKTVAQLGRDLDRHGIEYAVIGAVASGAGHTAVAQLRHEPITPRRVFGWMAKGAVSGARGGIGARAGLSW